MTTEAEREARRKAREDDKASQREALGHVGEVKQRLGFEKVKVIFTKSLENDWGVTTLIKFRMEEGEGNHLTWFASGDLTEEFPQGEIFDITGSVKKHDEFDGIPQTVITRVKIGLPKAKKSRKKKAQAK